MTTELDLSKAKLCVCGNLRRTMRAVTQHYDDTLKPSGLRVTQLIPLIVIAKRGPVTINQLAGYLGMDRTTLTRSLTPLQQQGFIKSVVGADQRTREVMLTARGRKALAKAMPLWEQAQACIARRLGLVRLNALLEHLSAVESVIQ